MEEIDTPGREDGGGDYQLSAQMRMVVVIGKLSQEPQSRCGYCEPPALLCRFPKGREIASLSRTPSHDAGFDVKESGV